MKIVRINLVPKKAGMKMPEIPYGTIMGILILIAVGYYLWNILQPKFDEELEVLRSKRSKLIKDKKKKLKRKQEELDSINRKIADMQSKINMVEGLISNDNIVAWTDIMEKLTEIVPRKKVWLTRFGTEGKSKVNILGKAVDTLQNVSLFVENLKKDPYFSKIHLGKATKNKVNQQEIWDFSLSCYLKRRSD